MVLSFEMEIPCVHQCALNTKSWECDCDSGKVHFDDPIKINWIKFKEN